MNSTFFTRFSGRDSALAKQSILAKTRLLIRIAVLSQEVFSSFVALAVVCSVLTYQADAQEQYRQIAGLIMHNTGSALSGARAALGRGTENGDPVGITYSYKEAAGQTLRLWIVSPPGHQNTDRTPAIVFFHGGGWVGGRTSQFDRQADYLAKRGMVVIQVEYRLLSKESATEPVLLPIEDAKSSMRWVRSHAFGLGIDPNRIAAAGGSAGGHLAAVVGLVDGINDPSDDLNVSAKPNAMILLNPAIDLGPGSCCYQRGGKDYISVSPLYHVRGDAAPMLIMSGSKDEWVPESMLTAFAAAMKESGVRCDLKIYPDQQHGFFNTGQYFYTTLEEIDRFLVSLHWLYGPPDMKALEALPSSPTSPPGDHGKR